MLSRFAGWCLVIQLKMEVGRDRTTSTRNLQSRPALRLNGGVSGGVRRNQMHCDN